MVRLNFLYQITLPHTHYHRRKKKNTASLWISHMANVKENFYQTKLNRQGRHSRLSQFNSSETERHSELFLSLQMLLSRFRPPVFVTWHPGKLGSYLPQRLGYKGSIFLQGHLSKGWLLSPKERHFLGPKPGKKRFIYISKRGRGKKLQWQVIQCQCCKNWEVRGPQ